MEIKPDNKFKQNLLLIIIGIVVFAVVMNIEKVADGINLIVGLFMPLIVGCAIAFVINVPMHFFEKQMDRLKNEKNSKTIEKLKTPVCLITTIVIAVAVIYFIGNVIFPNIIASVTSLVSSIQKSYPTWIEQLQAHGVNTDTINKYFPELSAEKIISAVKDGSLKLIDSVGQAATSVFGIVANFVLGFFFAIYILCSKKRLGVQAKRFAYAYLKEKWADEVCEIASLTYKTFSNFLSGQCLEAVILGTMFFIVLSIGGFPYAATIAVIIGAMSLVPWIGAFIGLLFGSLMIAVISVKKMIAFIIVFFVVQQIEGQIIYPRVVGGSIGLPAIWTLFAVVVGGNLSGILGIIVFIPLCSVIYALVRRNVYRRLEKKKITIEI